MGTMNQPGTQKQNEKTQAGKNASVSEQDLNQDLDQDQKQVDSRDAQAGEVMKTSARGDSAKLDQEPTKKAQTGEMGSADTDSDLDTDLDDDMASNVNVDEEVDTKNRH